MCVGEGGIGIGITTISNSKMLCIAVQSLAPRVAKGKLGGSTISGLCLCFNTSSRGSIA